MYTRYKFFLYSANFYMSIEGVCNADFLPIGIWCAITKKKCLSKHIIIKYPVEILLSFLLLVLEKLMNSSYKSKFGGKPRPTFFIRV